MKNADYFRKLHQESIAARKMEDPYDMILLDLEKAAKSGVNTIRTSSMSSQDASALQNRLKNDGFKVSKIKTCYYAFAPYEEYLLVVSF